jgi:hypothetical protein
MILETLIILSGTLWLLLKFDLLKFTSDHAINVAHHFDLATRQFGSLKIDIHATLLQKEGADASYVFFGIASSELNQWALSWDGTISADTYAVIKRLLSDLRAPDFRVSRVTVTDIVLPDAPKPKETPAQRVRKTLDTAVATVEELHSFKAEISQNEAFIRDVVKTMNSIVRRHDWRL